MVAFFSYVTYANNERIIPFKHQYPTQKIIPSPRILPTIHFLFHDDLQQITTTGKESPRITPISAIASDWLKLPSGLSSFQEIPHLGDAQKAIAFNGGSSHSCHMPCMSRTQDDRRVLQPLFRLRLFAVQVMQSPERGEYCTGLSISIVVRTREIIEVMAVNESKRSEVKCDPSLAVPQARWVVCQPTKSSGKGIIRVARLVYHLSYELS